MVMKNGDIYSIIIHSNYASRLLLGLGELDKAKVPFLLVPLQIGVLCGQELRGDTGVWRPCDFCELL